MIPARMLILCSLTFLLAGCQQKSATLNPVNGKVQYKGSLLPGGLIVFTPDVSCGESGPCAVGEIRPDGTYVLKSGDDLGAAAGWYRVTVASLSNTVSSVDTLPLSLIPEKYRDPHLSLLQCEVKPNRDNHLDFNLD